MNFQSVLNLQMYSDVHESSSSTDSEDELLQTKKFKKIKQNKCLLGISI